MTIPPMKNQGDQPDTRVEHLLQNLRKEYVVVGKTRVKAWHAWLALGLVVGIISGIRLVANRSGTFELGRAATKSQKQKKPPLPPRPSAAQNPAPGCGNSPVCNITFTQAGVATVRVAVTDNEGKRTTGAYSVVVGGGGDGDGENNCSNH